MRIKNMNRRICSYLIYYFFNCAFLRMKMKKTLWTKRRSYWEVRWNKFQNTHNWTNHHWNNIYKVWKHSILKVWTINFELTMRSNTMASCCFTRDYNWILTLKIYRKYLWPYKLVWSVGIIWNTMQNIV